MRGVHCALAVRFSRPRFLSAAALESPSLGPLMSLEDGSPEEGSPSSHSVRSTLEEARQQVNFIFSRLVAKNGGVEKLRWPSEIVALTGAPGAGKGTNISIIKAERDIAESLEVSSLFSTPAFEAMKATGRLISDSDVIGTVMEALLNPKYVGGLILDGYPRTAVQAASLVALSERLDVVCASFSKHPDVGVRHATRRPRMTLAVLHCDEEESVRRQMSRGAGLSKAAKLLKDVGEGGGAGARETDLNESRCRLRYSVFKAEVATCLAVVRENPFHGLRHLVIDASGSQEDVARQTRKMFAYAAELDLDANVYELLRPVKSASSLVQQARSKLVSRLGGYMEAQPDVFSKAVSLVHDEIMPKLEFMSLSGAATVRTVNPLLREHPGAINMVLDVS
jgi:adenylate kinase family enzyme